MKPRKILSFAIGPIGAALLGFIILPIITWLFSQEDVGKIAMLNVTVKFSTLLFCLGLDQAYVREYHEVNDIPALLKRALLPGLSILMIVVVIFLSCGDLLAKWLFDKPSWELSLLVAVTLIVAFISRFLSLSLRMSERGIAFSMSELLPKLALLAIVSGYLIVGVEKSLTNLVCANAAAFIVVFIVLVINTRDEWLASIGRPLNWSHLKKMLQFGSPLIVGGLAYWGLTAIDKVFLRALASFEDLGVYSVAVSFAGAATILQGVFSTVWAPTVYKWASQGFGLENVYKVSRYILAIVAIIFCLAGLFSWIVTFFLPDEYFAVRWILISCLGAPLFYTLSETTAIGIGISRRSSFSMLASLFALIINVLGNWFMIPHYGAAGAAVSTCVSFWVFFILRTEFSNYLWKPIPRRILYVYTALMTIGSSISTLHGVDVYMNIFWFFFFVLSLITFKGEIAESISFIKLRLINNKKNSYR